MQPPQAPAILPYLRDSLIRVWKIRLVSRSMDRQSTFGAVDRFSHYSSASRWGYYRRYSARLHKFLRDCGRILLSFWKEKWDYARLIVLSAIITPIRLRVCFGSREPFGRNEFDIIVSSGPSPFSRAITAATLDTMLQHGAIDGQEYLELLPPESFPKVPHPERRKQKKKRRGSCF